jgi:hypothetical protein
LFLSFVVVLSTISPSHCAEFLCALFGVNFFPEAMNLQTALENEIDRKYPILLCSKAGYDPGFRVDELAHKLAIRHYVSIAMGSKEGFENADTAVELGMIHSLDFGASLFFFIIINLFLFLSYFIFFSLVIYLLINLVCSYFIRLFYYYFFLLLLFLELYSLIHDFYLFTFTLSHFLASRVGGWVLLKNVHLTSNWLKKLDKKLHSTRHSIHHDFHLFLTSDINPNLPATLVSTANKLIFEPPNGIKANLLRTLLMVC